MNKKLLKWPGLKVVARFKRAIINNVVFKINIIYSSRKAELRIETLYMAAPIYRIYTTEEDALYYTVGADVNKALE